MFYSERHLIQQDKKECGHFHCINGFVFFHVTHNGSFVPLNEKYYYFSNPNIWSDIYEHLPTFRRYAKECDTIIEMGTRSVVGTYIGTLTGAFTLDKTSVLISGVYKGSVVGLRKNNNTVQITTTATSTNTEANTLLDSTTIEIRVYP